LIHTVSATVEAVTTVVNASAAIIVLVDGCRLAAADVAPLLSLASHLGNEIMRRGSKNNEDFLIFDFIAVKASQKHVF
jgi:hypothetical protein